MKMTSDKAKVIVLEAALTNMINMYGKRDENNDLLDPDEQEPEVSAAILAVSGCRKYHIWTNKEIEIVRDIYPGGGRNAVRRLLPHLSGSQIAAKAYQIGVRCKN